MFTMCICYILLVYYLHLCHLFLFILMLVLVNILCLIPGQKQMEVVGFWYFPLGCICSREPVCHQEDKDQNSSYQRVNFWVYSNGTYNSFWLLLSLPDVCLYARVTSIMILKGCLCLSALGIHNCSSEAASASCMLNVQRLLLADGAVFHELLLSKELKFKVFERKQEQFLASIKPNFISFSYCLMSKIPLTPLLNWQCFTPSLNMSLCFGCKRDGSFLPSV